MRTVRVRRSFFSAEGPRLTGANECDYGADMITSALIVSSRIVEAAM